MDMQNDSLELLTELMKSHSEVMHFAAVLWRVDSLLAGMADHIKSALVASIRTGLGLGYSEEKRRISTIHFIKKLSAPGSLPLVLRRTMCPYPLPHLLRQVLRLSSAPRSMR